MPVSKKALGLAAVAFAFALPASAAVVQMSPAPWTSAAKPIVCKSANGKKSTCVQWCKDNYKKKHNNPNCAADNCSSCK